MEEWIRIVAFLDREKDIPVEVVKRHVKWLAAHDSIIELCGPFPKDGTGMVVFKMASKKHVKEIAETDPFVAEGYCTLTLKKFVSSNMENNHLGMLE